MGKRAKLDLTPEQRAAEPLPLDDDARWLPIEAAYQRRAERTGNTALADIDLTKALMEGHLRCMARSTTTGERKPIPPTMWADQIKLHSSRREGVLVVHRRQPDDDELVFCLIRPFRGWAFYIWQPDFDRIWPPPTGSAPLDHDDDSNSPPPVKPGPKPRGDWPTLVAQWLIEVAADDPKRLQNVDALVTEAKIFLRNQIKWAPKDDKDLRAKIRELLGSVRR